MKRREILLGAAAGAVLSALPMTVAAASATIPKRLKPGATIGLIAPASVTYERLQLQLAVETIEAMGLKAKIGSHVMDRFGYLAGKDQDRADDLNEAFADPDVDAVFALRGGWGASRILPMLDYDMIRQNPKILLGYSDVTSLLNAIFAKSGLVTFHGPNVMSEWNEFTYSEMRRLLFDAEPQRYENPVIIEDDLVARTYRTQTITSGKASGQLIGGNLTLISTLMGTPYLPDFSEKILILEDVDEAVYRIDRMLTQLALSGDLQKLSGIIFGHFTGADGNRRLGNFSLMDILRQHCEPLGIPCFTGAMFGHVDKQSTVPIGAEAKMDADRGTFALIAPAVA